MKTSLMGKKVENKLTDTFTVRLPSVTDSLLTLTQLNYPDPDWSDSVNSATE